MYFEFGFIEQGRAMLGQGLPAFELGDGFIQAAFFAFKGSDDVFKFSESLFVGQFFNKERGLGHEIILQHGF